MPLVEWGRLQPGQVEALVGLFVNREYPRSVRITPSRGDGGVDILDRAAAPGGGDVVYQVKSYTEGLSQRQKDSIEDSLTALRKDERWAGLRVEEWRLVTPWNPSPEAENWLHDLGGAVDLPVVWHGLDYVEQLAAKYPDVIDYYLRGGQAAVAAAQAEVLTLLGLERVDEALTVDEVTGRVRRALGVLDHDPHYFFEFRFGRGEPPAPSARPGLVMHTLRAERTADRWVAVDVIARCAASVELQPITINGTVQVEAGGPFEEQWRDFVTYGVPVSLPVGSFEGELAAPGGLGGPLRAAALRAGPAEDTDVGDNPELHLEVLDPAGTVIAEADVERVERSQGVGGGLRVVLRETHGVFEFEDRYDLAGGRASRAVRVGTVVGLPVEVARAGVNLITHLQAPNQLRVSVRHTPPERGVIDGNTGFEWSREDAEGFGATLRILKTLCELQAATSRVLRVPDLAQVPREQFRAWRVAAALLRGEEIRGTYPEGHGLTVDLASAITPGEEALGILLPLTVLINDELVDLGRYELWLESPTLLDSSERPDGSVAHTFTTADRSFVWRRAKASGG